jgi:hypothetical protein
MGFYDDMQAVARDVIGEFAQGTIIYVELQPQEGGTPDDPLPPVSVEHSIDAVTRPVEFKYVDGTQIVQSDEQFTMPGGGVEPTMDGKATIDGRACKIVGIKRIPAAGTVITYTVIVRR